MTQSIRLPTALSFVAMLWVASVAPFAEAKIAIGLGRGGAPAGGPATKPIASPHVLTLDKVNIASFSPDGQTLMTVAEDDRQVHFWSAQTGEETNRFGVAVSGAIFSASGNR